MSYDPKCLELADYFLPEHATVKEADELAQAIQNTVEDYLLYKLERKANAQDQTQASQARKPFRTATPDENLPF